MAQQHFRQCPLCMNTGCIRRESHVPTIHKRLEADMITEHPNKKKPLYPGAMFQIIWRCEGMCRCYLSGSMDHQEALKGDILKGGHLTFRLCCEFHNKSSFGARLKASPQEIDV